MFTILVIFISLLLGSVPQSPFGERSDLGIIDYSQLKEISGIAAGRVNKDIFWLHNDSGNDNKIYAIDRSAKLKAVYVLKGIKLIDTEDIAIGLGPEKGENYIYLADIGDNDATRDKKFIYRFKEPHIPSSDSVISAEIVDIDTLSFVFPDGKRDAETIMIDPLGMDIVIVSKRDENAHVYIANIPPRGSSELNFKNIAHLPFGYEGFNNSGVTAGDIAGDGSEILIKTYSKVYYYRRLSGEKLQETFSRKPVNVDYIMEPQGEALCFGAKNEGFYTTSESSPLNITPHLYFYRRISTGIDEGYLPPAKLNLNDLNFANIDIYSMEGKRLPDIKTAEDINTGMYFLKFTYDDTSFFRNVFIVK